MNKIPENIDRCSPLPKNIKFDGADDYLSIKRQPKKFHDNSLAPILAVDFDDTISINGKYPIPGDIRPYAKEVINFLISVGTKVVLHTCRDNAIHQDFKVVVDDITPMITWMMEHGIGFSAINKSIQFAPYHYNGRKIYAHMYIDDRGFGWNECDNIMLIVLDKFLIDVIGVHEGVSENIIYRIRKGEEVPHDVAEIVRERIRNWNKNDIL